MSNCLGVKLVAKPGIYLGAYLDLSERNGVLFSRIVSKFHSKLRGWKRGFLFFPGKCVLAKHSMLAIPVYLLSVFKAPLYFV